jgi:hypothetical protein
MRLRNLIRALVLVLVMSVAAGASFSAAAKSRWYQVEVIVFQHNDVGAAGGEQWPDLGSLPDFRDAINLFGNRPSESAPANGERPNEVALPGPIAFQSLPGKLLKMSGVYHRLGDLGAYTPIAHVGWRQPGLGGTRARSVYISDKPRLAADVSATSLDPSGAQLVEGSVQIRVGRLLHVVTDFVKYGATAPVRITEQRQVKLKEIHYFDHPLFGVIVQVTPYRAADPGDVPD